MNRDELLAVIQVALGEASMCWSNIEGAGVFQSDRAIEIAQRLADRIPLQEPPQHTSTQHTTFTGQTRGVFVPDSPVKMASDHSREPQESDK